MIDTDSYPQTAEKWIIILMPIHEKDELCAYGSVNQ